MNKIKESDTNRIICHFYLKSTKLRWVGMVLLLYLYPPNLNLNQNSLSNTFRNKIFTKTSHEEQLLLQFLSFLINIWFFTSYQNKLLLKFYTFVARWLRSAGVLNKARCDWVRFRSKEV